MTAQCNHRIGGNPERWTAIGERGSIMQPAFYGMLIKLSFFFFQQKESVESNDEHEINFRYVQRCTS